MCKMLGFSIFLEIVVKPTSNELIARAYDYDDDDKDDDYEDDEEDGQVNVHVTAFGDHAQNTGIYSIFCSLYNSLRSTMSLFPPSPPTHPPPGTTAKHPQRPKTQKNRG